MTNGNTADRMLSLLDESSNLAAHRRELLDGLKRLLRELHDAREFDFRRIAESIYDGIFITDGEGRTVFVNKAYSRITGIEPEEVLGEYVKDLSTRGLWKNAVTPEVLRTRQQVNSLAEAMRTGAKMLVTGIPLFDQENNIRNVVVIDRDITDHLAMQSELEETKEKMKTVESDRDKHEMQISLLRKRHMRDELVGNSRHLRDVRETIEKIADLDVTVLITGGTGTGKEVVANKIYSRSRRNGGPFIRVNCAAIPANLLESELFGYEKGAFTGASTAGRFGMFELANKGTILLDEIGEVPLDVQPKLLRAIQDKEIYRVGGKTPQALDIRIIAATNRNLRQLVADGLFREDLFYRLNVFPIDLLPLCRRADDIEPLAQHFLGLYNEKYGKKTSFGRGCVETMRTYGWPGNVREMQNIIERVVIISARDEVIGPDILGRLLGIGHFPNLPVAATSLKEILESAERIAIEKALADHHSTRKAARALRIGQSSIIRKSKKLGIVTEPRAKPQ